ncbi:MAG: MerR family transcriptional regulator [Firmicutes bacterium]|nr:MerR family transcriptional regulator [Bacillota bacterium]
MKVKEVSLKTGIPKRTIHFYVNEHLITPSINTENNYYNFSEEDCQRLIFIREMRSTGMPIPEIQSIMKTPEAASFYINRQIKKLKNEKRHIEQVLISMKYIMDEMPLFPNLNDLRELCDKANIPSTIEEYEVNSRFDNYNTLFINKVLWSGFLPKTKLTEYQEFLWMKLNKQTLENPSDDYIKVGTFLNNLPALQLDYMLTHQNDHFTYIASLDEEGIKEYTMEIIQKIQHVISVPEFCQLWKLYYKDYFYPSVTIHVSNLKNIMIELSPLFRAYTHNIDIICENAYYYLHSKDGNDLLEQMQYKLNGYIDIDSNNHGELEILSYLPKIAKIMK